MTASAIGWSSAALLVLTIAAQILRQWRARTRPASRRGSTSDSFAPRAASPPTASCSTTWCIILNAIMASAALLGLGIWFRFRRLDRRAS
jgi:hypothetical protein